MTKIVVAGFGKYLNFKHNSCIDILSEIKKPDIIKIILPVGYFKNDFIKPLKRYTPEKYVCLGMWNGKYSKIETIAKNEMITLKNPIARFFVQSYTYILKSFNTNLTIKKPMPKKYQKILSIEKNEPNIIKLRNQPPRSIKGLKISTNPGNFICNYMIWNVEKYLQRNNLKTKFYFIHIPEILSTKERKKILNLINKF